MTSNIIQKINMLSPTILFFLCATLFWTVAWYVYFEILFVFSLYYWLWLLVALFFLLFTARIRGLRIISACAWAYPAGLLVILFISMASYLLSYQNLTYRIGLDIKTPTGLLSASSMIKVTSRPHLIPSLKKIIASKSSVKGEAVFCDLGDGKALVALLAFPDSNNGTHRLVKLPFLAEKKEPRVSGRVELQNELIPILMYLSDVNNSATIKRVTPNSLASVLGEEYSMRSAWVEYPTSFSEEGSIRQRMPWVVATNNGFYVYSRVLRKHGIVCGYNPFFRYN